MKKSIIFAVALLGIATAMCAPTKVENQITWEEACEISWAEFLRVNNYQDLPWEEQPDSVQNEFLDCWSGSTQEDSILCNYKIIEYGEENY